MKGWTIMRKRRSVVFLFFLLTMAAALFLCTQTEKQVCMGVKILTEAQQEKLQADLYEDLSQKILYNGQRAAVDAENITIYIAQNIQPGMEPKDLLGNLSFSDPSYRLYFAPDEAFSDLAAAAAQGHPFKLNIIDNINQCMQYRVIFTTLPVLRLDGTLMGQTEEGTDVLEGELCLWTPADPETGRYSVQNSTVQWHIRGNTAAMLDKKSWKLSLKNSNGTNRNLSLVGLGEDDDWILNAMRQDDTKLKEKLFMDLWNNWSDQTSWNYKMSTGEYVEVVCNSSYSGIYLLQRRPDQKYYQLSESDILLKGGNILIPNNPQEAYRVVYSPYEQQDTLCLMEGIRTGSNVSMIDPDNFLDINLFLQYASAIDNTGFKNIFYLLKNQENSYRLYMIPWDTDMSWGVVFDSGFVYDYQMSMGKMISRQEYPFMLQKYPDLDALMSLRWKELRKSVLSEDNVQKLLDETQTTLRRSGALTREINHWGPVYENDTAENLYKFLMERLRMLDDYYM